MIMENTNKVADSVASTLFLLDENTDELVFCTPTGPIAAQLVNMRIKRGQGVVGWVLENGKPANVPDVSRDPRFFKEIDTNTGFQTKALLCVPLKLAGRTIGVLEAVNKKDGSSFTKKDTLLLSIFADQTVMAIENARLHGALENQLQETLRLQERLSEAEKSRVLTKLSTGIAHDFNNILNAITGFAEILHLDAEDEKTREDIDEILRASHSAMDLVEQILAFTKQSPHKKSPVSSRNCFKQAVKLFRIFLPQNIQIHENLSLDNAQILANSTQLHHAITQIFKNARDAIGHEEGILDVTFTVVKLDSVAISFFPGLKPGTYVKYTISDNGCGMDPVTLNQAFEPYFSTKIRTVGTGMGLPAVKGIIKDHGGALSISSAPGQGTRVEILLPRHESKPTARPRALDELPRGTEKIMVVDDEKIMANTMKKMLQSLGYQVVTVFSSAEALETFNVDPHDFDLVFTDWAMPGITGDRLAEIMVETKPDTKVILYSAFDEGMTKENFRPQSIRRTLKKPISMEKLAFSVRQVLDTPPGA